MKIGFFNFGYAHAYFDNHSEKTTNKNINNDNNKIKLNELGAKYFTPVNLNFTSNTKIPLYAIYKDGSCKKYPSIKSAADDTGCKRQEIRQIINGAALAKNGYTFVKASLLETQNLLGETRVDKKQIERIAAQIDKSIYVISKNGKYNKFETQKQAAEFIGCSKPSVTYTLQGIFNTVKGYMIVPSSKIEYRDENNNLKVDEEKIREIAQFCNKDIYAINKDGSFQKFNTQREAAQYMGTSDHLVSQIMQGLSKSVRNTTFVKACDIETLDENGNYIPDIKKIARIAIEINTEIYAINKNGEYKKFKTQKQAAQYYGIDEHKISNMIKKHGVTKDGTTFVKSPNIETFNKDGKIIPNMKKIEQIAKSINGGFM